MAFEKADYDEVYLMVTDILIKQLNPLRKATVQLDERISRIELKMNREVLCPCNNGAECIASKETGPDEIIIAKRNLMKIGKLIESLDNEWDAVRMRCIIDDSDEEAW